MECATTLSSDPRLLANRLGQVLDSQKHLSLNLISLALVVCWLTCLNRNAKLFGMLFIPILDLIAWSEDFLPVFKISYIPSLIGGCSWLVPPPRVVIKIKFDASSPFSSRSSTMALLVETFCDLVCYGGTRKLAQPSPMDGEMTAALHGFVC